MSESNNLKLVVIIVIILVLDLAPLTQFPMFENEVFLCVYIWSPSQLPVSK